MKDYYKEYLDKKNRNMTVRAVSKVSKGHFEDQIETFDTFDTHLSSLNPQFSVLEDLLSSNYELREQFIFEIAERTAIMILDGNLSEGETINLARNTTAEIWSGLF